MKIRGFLPIHKPTGITSFDALRELKKVTGKLKIGHAGTLDPFASGLLLVAIDRTFTKQIDKLQALDKTYRFTITFGKETDTLDSDGTVIKTADTSVVTEDKLRSVLPDFLGTQKQVPPAYSAKKINGERAYKLAREGKTVTLDAVDITIHSIDLLDFNPDTTPSAEIRITCSKGTYVRSLARDIALKCDTVGFTSSLIREGIGPYSVDDALLLNSLDLSDIQKHLFHDILS